MEILSSTRRYENLVRFLPPAILIIAVILVCLPSLHNGFVWDDSSIIVENADIKSFSSIPKLFASEDTLPFRKTGFYRPLTYITYLIDYKIWGLNPLGFHLTNILLHALSTSLFYLLVLTVFKQRTLAFVSASIFSFYPVQTETVNFISGGRNTLLCAVFILGSYIAYLKDKKPLSFFLYAFSLLSKEFSLMMPFMLMIHIRLLSPTERWKKTLANMAPYFIAIFMYLTARYFVTKGFVSDWGVIHLKILLIPKILMTYLKVLLFPWDLTIPYHLSMKLDATSFAAILGMLSLVLILIRFRRSNIILYGALWTFVFFLPVSGIISFSDIPAAERYIYISSMGFSLIISSMLLKLKSKVLVPITCALLISFAAMITVRTPIWKNNESLFAQMIKDSPDSSIGYHNMGLIYSKKGELDKAEQLLVMAVRKTPRLVDIYYNLATLYILKGEINKAISYLDEAISGNIADPKIYILSSLLYDEKGDAVASVRYSDAAKENFPSIVEISTVKAIVLSQLGVIFKNAGKKEEAIIKFKLALKHDSNMSDALFELGYLLSERKNYNSAIEYFHRVTEINPERLDARYNLSLAYQLTGQSDKARMEMKKYLELGGSPTWESNNILGYTK